MALDLPPPGRGHVRAPRVLPHGPSRELESPPTRTAASFKGPTWSPVQRWRPEAGPAQDAPHGPMLHSEHQGVDGMGFFSARGEIPEATDVLVAGLSGIRS